MAHNRGDWQRFVDREVRDDAAVSVTAGVRRATEGLKQGLRRQVAAAGLGVRLGNTIRSQDYPGGTRSSLGATGLVYVRRAKTGRSGPVEIFDAFNRGATILPTGGRKYLAIPTASVPQVRGRASTPAELEARYGRKLYSRPARKGRHLLLFLPGFRDGRRRRKGEGNVRQTDVLMFVLVPLVRLPKRLDFDAEAQAWADAIPGLIPGQR